MILLNYTMGFFKFLLKIIYFYLNYPILTWPDTHNKIINFLKLWKASFGHFQTAISPRLGWVWASYLHDEKALGNILPMVSSLHDFDVIWWRYAFSKLGYWSRESPITDLNKGKLVFLLKYFLIRFKRFIGLKIGLMSVFKKLIHA